MDMQTPHRKTRIWTSAFWRWAKSANHYTTVQPSLKPINAISIYVGPRMLPAGCRCASSLNHSLSNYSKTQQLNADAAAKDAPQAAVNFRGNPSYLQFSRCTITKYTFRKGQRREVPAKIRNAFELHIILALITTIHHTHYVRAY